MVVSTAYHDAMPAQSCRALQACNDPASLLVRTRADRIAVHGVAAFSFFLEIKTGMSKVGQDHMPEMLPLCAHRTDSRFFGAKTVYVYRNTLSGFETCYLADDSMPMPSAILIGKQKIAMREVVQRWAKPWWPNIPIYPCNMPNSGDPCLRIPERNLTRKPFREFFSAIP